MVKKILSSVWEKQFFRNILFPMEFLHFHKKKSEEEQFS